MDYGPFGMKMVINNLKVILKRTKKNSLWTNWHANKQVREKGHYINDKEDGEWIYWNDKGIKVINGFFHEGDKIRVWNFWYSNGNKKQQIDYDSGKKISESCWDKNGEIISCL